MPEGDTIHKIAGFMGPRLRGRTLRDVTMADRPAAASCRGRRVEDVHARGKHLFIELDNRTALRSHLGMYGSWHVYAHGDEWRKPRRRASLVIRTDDSVYVCFSAKEIELVRSPTVRERIVETRLGPDLIADDFDPDYVVRRAREFAEPDDLLADVLLDQRIACGIGNVYKSEVLFIERLPPQATLGDVADADVARCFTTAARLLRRNLSGGRRVTRFEADGAGRLWVYGRTGLPCLRCDDGHVEGSRLGRRHRGTFWCPACQQGRTGPP